MGVVVGVTVRLEMGERVVLLVWEALGLGLGHGVGLRVARVDREGE